MWKIWEGKGGVGRKIDEKGVGREERKKW